MPPKRLENIAPQIFGKHSNYKNIVIVIFGKHILCFERRFSKQNSVIRLKSNIFAPQTFCPFPQIFGMATSLPLLPAEYYAPV